MGDKLFTCLIEEQNSEEAFVQVYWSHASHLGKAIQLILDLAKTNGLRNPIPRECDPYDIENLEEEIEPCIESKVFWSTNRYFFPPEPTFDLPVGIIASCIEGEHDVDEIERGFTIQTDDELTTIEVNVESDKLFSLYRKLINKYPEYKVFWYILHDHWDGEAEDRFLVNESLNTPEKIITHLSNNQINSIQNGFVTLTAYLEEGASNISISDHKRIIIKTYSSVIAECCRKVLENCGYPNATELVSIDSKIHHWHYCVDEGKSKLELEGVLKQSGFNDWNPGKKANNKIQRTV